MSHLSRRRWALGMAVAGRLMAHLSVSGARGLRYQEQYHQLSRMVWRRPGGGPTAALTERAAGQQPKQALGGWSRHLEGGHHPPATEPNASQCAD